MAPGTPSLDQRAVNQCQTDANCMGGGRCMDGSCQGTEGDFTALLLAVAPSASDSNFASVTFYDTRPLPTSGPNTLDIEVGQTVAFSGYVRIDATTCAATFMPTTGPSAGTELAQAADPLDSGPMSRSFRASACSACRQLSTPATMASDSFKIGVTVPPGDYDVYIRPYPQPTDDQGNPMCPVPPRLLLRQTVAGNLDFKLTPASPLFREHRVAARHQLRRLVGRSRRSGFGSRLVDSARAQRPRAGCCHRARPDGHGAALVRADLRAGREGNAAADADRHGARAPDPPPTGSSPPVLLAQLSGAALGDSPGTSAPAVLRQSDPLPSPVNVQLQTDLLERRHPRACRRHAHGDRDRRTA